MLAIPLSFDTQLKLVLGFFGIIALLILAYVIIREWYKRQ